MRVYQHPIEHRRFYAPDTQPSLDLHIPLLHVSGLDDYIIPHPAGHQQTRLTRTQSGASGSASGSGPNGTFMGKDFRAAYGVTNLDGSGQEVGLFEFWGYYASDITSYEFVASLPTVPITNVPVGIAQTLEGPLSPTNSLGGIQEEEVASDIEMVISMAPHLAKVVVYEGYYQPLEQNEDNAADVLSTMANDTNNTVKQFSSSWTFAVDPNVEQAFQQFITQGQSFFQASGDGDAWVDGIKSPDDDPNITIVGGTTLTMNDSGTSYASETVWNEGYDPPGWDVTDNGYWGSGGGVSTVYSLPYWQQGISNSLNLASTTMRNIPDVAMVAGNIFVEVNNGPALWGGTSAAAPLWAGFTALVNQQAVLKWQTNVGFLNPTLYRIGKSPPVCGLPPFHDIVTGSNTWSGSPSKYFAVPGYDLCTGWGSPNGTNLINALLATPPTIYNNQPTSQSVAVGNTVIFAVGVGGTAPFSYQWFWNDSAHPLHDGGNISGSLTSTLAIENVQTTNAGSYYVVVCNPANCVTSGNAVLTVYGAGAPFVITFDDLPNSSNGAYITNGYQNLNWNNIGYVNGLTNDWSFPSGYAYAVVSPDNVAFNYNNNGSYQAEHSSSWMPFDFVSAWFDRMVR